MTALISDMIGALVSGGFGTAKNTDIYEDNIMPMPLAQLMVKLTGGRPPITTVDSQTAMSGIQVYVVDSLHDTARDKAEAIRVYFSMKKNTIRQAIWAARSDPIYLGQLDDGRHKFVVEFQVFG